MLPTRTAPTPNQPRSLYPIALVELWERFGYYAVQSFIVLYLSAKLLFTDHMAHQTMAIFSALLFFTPLLGGYLASRHLGFKISIMLGISLFLLGNMLCSMHSTHMLYWGLSLQILGNGFFKPNNSSLLGCTYGPQDPRRESGFTLFYMIANIGSLLPPLLIAGIIHRFGWHGGFAFAAGGFLLALFIFAYALKWIKNQGGLPEHSVFRPEAAHPILMYGALLLGMLLLLFTVHLALLHPTLANYTVEALASLVIVIVSCMLGQQPKKQRYGLLAIMIFVVLSVFFWAFYFQLFSDIMLFNQRFVHPSLLGVHTAPEWMQAYNPCLILILSPFLSWLWLRLNLTGHNPSIPSKFTLALLMTSGFFTVLYIAIRFFTHHGGIDAGWIFFAIIFLTLGELLLSPIGLAMITLLAPPKLTGVMMGVWFCSLAFGGALSGKLADLTDMSAQTQYPLQVFQHAFGINALLCLSVTLLAALLIPLLKRMIASAQHAT